MNEKLKYKRYMVFTWTEYDNVKPFSNVSDSFDDIDEARKEALLLGEYCDDGEALFCIFDRIEGVMI